MKSEEAMNEVLKTIAAKYKDDIVHTASELIQRNSQSLHEGEVAAYVQEKMKELGYDKVEVDRYGNVFGTMKGTGGGSSVMLNCHMDVVYEGDESLWPYPPTAARSPRAGSGAGAPPIPKAPWPFRSMFPSC